MRSWNFDLLVPLIWKYSIQSHLWREPQKVCSKSTADHYDVNWEGLPMWNTADDGGPGADHLDRILQLHHTHSGLQIEGTGGLKSGSISKVSSSEHLHLGEHKGKGTKTMHWNPGERYHFPFHSYYESFLHADTHSESPVLHNANPGLCQVNRCSEKQAQLHGPGTGRALTSTQRPRALQERRGTGLLSMLLLYRKHLGQVSTIPDAQELCWNTVPSIYKVGSKF